jgi:hypothetical protein
MVMAVTEWDSEEWEWVMEDGVKSTKGLLI